MDIFRKARRDVAEDGRPHDKTAPVSAAPAPAVDVDAAAAPAVASDAPAARWVGYIDFVDRSAITGWCYDAENPGRSVPIEVIASSGKRRVAIAGLFRQDVKEAGYGSGHHGFVVDLASFAGKDETFIVRFAESKVAITTEPFSLEPQRALLDGRMPKSFTTAMEVLALEARAFHAELDERSRRSGAVA